ncbi:MAG TPA: NUDIX hydrolase [Jiangellales bacterium]|nr:NUDIX hydrolase [Jiangellales bacterium]
MTAQLPEDHPERWPAEASRQVLETGRVISVREDTVRSPADGSTFTRDVVVHPGAVGVVALDDEDRVLLVQQYRHPVGHRLLEVPAGLLDVAGEDYLEAARRELFEEAHVRAEDWRVLVDYFTSPGMTTESLRVYLARGLSDVAVGDRHVGEHEEADMPVVRVPLTDLVAAVLGGRVHNPTLCVGVLATWAARHGAGYDALRDPRCPWPAREALPR